MTSFARLIETAPLATDSTAVERAWQKWQQARESARGIEDGKSVADPSEEPAYRSLLEGVFSGSPYLTNLVMREADLILDLMEIDPDTAMNRILGELAELTVGSATQPPMPNSQVSAILRRAKRRAALLIALADLGGVRDLFWVTEKLSVLAAAAVEAALSQLLLQAAAKGDLDLADPEAPTQRCGITVLAMGKMGAFELNYSSDIDLIVIYDPERITYRGKRSLPDFLSRLVRSLMQLMQERTGDGYVFRTDLRLRPDPSVSPLAIAWEAALVYYETLAQNWERAAMIKARAAAGDLELGAEFLDEMVPFIWRKSLDFAAIQDIQSIKRQIHASKGHDRIALAGHDIKVGRGGIREIEFFAQTQQLIAGGRDPRLRRPATLKAIAALVETGRVKGPTANELRDAYIFLRNTEHRLQMLDDAQTQKLPEQDEGLARLAAFSGFDTVEAFGEALLGHMQTVSEHYAELFAEQPSLASDHGNLVFTGTDDDPGTIETLQTLGFSSPSGVIATVKQWHSGRHRAMRTTRARQFLTTLVPELLQALAETADADAALANFDRFLARLPTGVQFMALLHSNPSLLKLLARIFGSAPALAEALGRNGGLLDILLEPGDIPADDIDEIRDHAAREMFDVEIYEDVLDAVRRFANDRVFQAGVGLLTGSLDFERATAALSAIAETVIATLLPRVEAEVARRHGHIADSGMAVIAMGKLGAGELTFGSDLDLVFVYDDRGDTRQSDGSSPLAIGPYFTRLSQRFISALTAMTSEGPLYEVDMRLRPSGNKGAVAVPLSAYQSYMQNDAWTWEIMAATRARIIAGPDRLATALDEALKANIAHPRDINDLRRAVLDMRARIDKQHGTNDIWSLKHVRGGLVDLEFTVQFLTLAHAADHPDIICGHTGDALKALGQAGLMSSEHVARLLEAYRLMKGGQTLLRLCHAHRFSEDAASKDFQHLTADTLGCPDFAAAKARLVQAQHDILACFEHYVGRT